jgi:hypothetical protein
MGCDSARDRILVKIAVSIDRAAAEAYEFLALPDNFPKWASGLKDAVAVRYSERNSYGVLDHAVTMPDGTTVYVPLRVIAQRRGCELVLTLFRRPGMSDEQFAADAGWVRRDLQNAKRILEQGELHGQQ